MPFTPLTDLNGTTSRIGSVQSAIAFAAQKTGIDFHYLLGQAKLESGLNASARAGTSSASGLYQFIEQSWMRVMKAHGAEHGLGWAADAIQSSGGRMSVADPAMRKAILDLRNDPATASIMAAEHASDNKDALESSLGRDATGTDLYMAHFLGLGGARSFLSAMQQSPSRSGAAMFPAAARANRGVFYDAGGQPRTLADIYSRFAAKLDSGAGAMPAVFTQNAPTALASTTLGTSGAEVIPGSSESSTADAAMWAQDTLDRLNGATSRYQTASLMRPTPDTAKLAYLMLASMGA